MDTDFNGTKVSQILEEDGYKVYVVPGSDHHLYFDNPEVLFDNLTDDLDSFFKTHKGTEDNRYVVHSMDDSGDSMRAHKRRAFQK